MLSIESTRALLHNENIRLTPQRLMIAEVLVGNKSHPTVEQVHEIVLTRYPSISLATVYNTVSLLARCGLVSVLHGGKDGLRLDPETTSHAHAHCTRCGRVMDVAIIRAPKLDQGTLDGFRRHQLEVSLFGYCPRCTTQD